MDTTKGFPECNVNITNYCIEDKINRGGSVMMLMSLTFIPNSKNKYHFIHDISHITEVYVYLT